MEEIKITKRKCLCSTDGVCILDGKECDGLDLNKDECELANSIDANAF